MAAAPAVTRDRRHLAARWERLNGTSRVPGVDLARGVAVVGMFAAHLLWIGDFDWDIPQTWPDVVNGRSSILFATLAGVSIGLVSGRMFPLSGRPLVLARRRLAVRAVLIWFLGLVLVGLEVPVYVILPAYAILFLIVLPLLRLTPGWLFALAATIALTMPFVQFFIEEWPLWGTQRGLLVETLIGGHYPFLVWSAFVVAGLGIARVPFSKPAAALWMLGAGAALAALGYGVSGATTGLREAGSAGLVAFVTDGSAHSSGAAEAVGSGGFAIAVIGLCVLVTSTPLTWLVLPLRAVGAMALTAYTGQIVVWALLQPQPGPGESALSAFRDLEPFWPLTAWTIVLCTAWTLLVGRGPVEWLVDRVVRFAVSDGSPERPVDRLAE